MPPAPMKERLRAVMVQVEPVLMVMVMLSETWTSVSRFTVAGVLPVMLKERLPWIERRAKTHSACWEPVMELERVKAKAPFTKRIPLMFVPGEGVERPPLNADA